MRLSADNLGSLAPQVDRFEYDRERHGVGIVHLGIGAFHRAHQAWYTDRAMDAGDSDWMITGASLRSPATADELNPQAGLYTVTERSAEGEHTRLVGSVREVIVAPRDPATLVARIADAQTRIVNFTVTEKGYCRSPDGSLDLALADNGSFYPLLALAMQARAAAGAPGLTLMSCDNLAQNGRQLSTLILQYLDARAPRLGGWFEAECRCPSSMVDRIVPAATEAGRSALADRIGVEDHAAVFTEPFCQWVIEDRFAAARPGWDKVGAQIVSDVEPYETAKLRLLNGAHSALAYLGLERGHTFVHQAIADRQVRPLIERLMREEAAPTISAAPEQNLDAYCDALLARFANPALEHRLAQIAMDGSQKVSQRWLETLAIRQQRNLESPSLETALSAWLRHVRGDNGPVDDPLAETMSRLWSAGDERDVGQRFFGKDGLLASAWVPPRAFPGPAA